MKTSGFKQIGLIMVNKEGCVSAKVIIVTSLEEFIHHITVMQEQLLRDPAKKLYFRGQSNSEWFIIPSLVRGPNGNKLGHLPISHESDLIHDAISEFPSKYDNLTPLETLATLQHLGIPTRLLDITENPLVALYFAVANCEGDGEIFVFDRKDFFKSNSAMCEAIADSYRTLPPSGKLIDFYHAMLDKPYAYGERINIDNKYESNEEDLIDWVKECFSKPFFAFAKRNSQRQRAQQGAFLLFSNRVNEQNIITDEIAPLSKDDPLIKIKIVIPCSFKHEIKNLLNMCGVNQAALFPDSTELVYADIVNRYRYKNSQFV